MSESTAKASAEDRRQIIETLRLPPDVPDAVVQAALANPLYAHHLAATADAEKLRAQLLRNPPAVAESAAPATRAVATKAMASVLSWARTGFASVPEETFKARMEACEACPHARPAPKTALYRLAGGDRDMSASKICGLCGCLLGRKARMASEDCPDADPRTGATRWPARQP